MKLKKIQYLILLSSISIFTSCANLTHYSKAYDGNGKKIILADAKQRALTSFDGVNCAEPSPDALSALAASQNLKLSVNSNKNLDSAYALSESAGAIGLRTQSIQILRDHMFRVCEAYQSKQLSPAMVALLHRRFQTTTIAILAIEQLTGAMRAPTIVLGGNSSYGNAEALKDILSQRKITADLIPQLDEDLKKKTTEYEAAENLVKSKSEELKKIEEGNNPTEASITNAKKELDKAKADFETKKINKELSESALTNNKALLASIDNVIKNSGVSGNTNSNGRTEVVINNNNASIEKVADIIRDIVKDNYELTNTKDFCTIVLLEAIKTEPTINTKNEIVTKCLEKLGLGEMRATENVKK